MMVVAVATTDVAPIIGYVITTLGFAKVLAQAFHDVVIPLEVLSGELVPLHCFSVLGSLLLRPDGAQSGSVR